MYTLTTKEYRTVSSILLMLRWRTSKDSLSKTPIIFGSWPGIRREMIFKTTFEPEIFASTSATDELQHAPTSTPFSNPNGLLSDPKATNCAFGLGPGLGLILFLLRLFDSKDCNTWCNSLMNSMTPPIMEAWSPCNN